MASPLTSKIATSPAAVVWTNGESFDGFILFTLSLPSAYTQHALKSAQMFLPIPRYTRVPVVGGVVDTASEVYYNSELNPPGTTYTASFYDAFGNLIAAVAGGNFSVTTSITTLTVPTLTVPT